MMPRFSRSTDGWNNVTAGNSVETGPATQKHLSSGDLRKLMNAANERYLAYMYEISELYELYLSPHRQRKARWLMQPVTSF